MRKNARERERSARERGRARESARERKRARESARERERARESARERERVRESAREREKARESAREHERSRESAREHNARRGTCTAILRVIYIMIIIKWHSAQSGRTHNLLGTRWLRSVGSIKLQVSSAEYRLCCRAPFQMRPIILSNL